MKIVNNTVVEPVKASCIEAGDCFELCNGSSVYIKSRKTIDGDRGFIAVSLETGDAVEICNDTIVIPREAEIVVKR